MLKINHTPPPLPKFTVPEFTKYFIHLNLRQNSEYLKFFIKFNNYNVNII